MQPPAQLQPPPPPPQFQSQSSPLPLLLHDADRNFILTPLTPNIPVSLRSRTQLQLDTLSAAVLMYVLHRSTALLPVRMSDVNSKVIKDTARGAGRVVLKDVARRLRVIFGLRLVEADKSHSTSSTAAAAGAAAGGSQRGGRGAAAAEGADGAAAGGSGGGKGRKRGRAAAATSTTSSSADSYIVTCEPSTTSRTTTQQQIELSSDGTDATTPKRLLSSWRAHSALITTTLALCAFTYKDGIIAEERLLSLLAGLFGLGGSVRELRQTTEHVLFGDVTHLITHTLVEQQYLERVTLQHEDGDFSQYGAPSGGEPNKVASALSCWSERAAGSRV